MSTTKEDPIDDNDDSFKTCNYEQAADTRRFTLLTSDDESPTEQDAQNKISNDADLHWLHNNQTSTRRMSEETSRIENLSMLSRPNRNDGDMISTRRISTISFASNVHIPIDENETAIMYPDEKEENTGLLPDEDPDDDEATLEDNGGDYDLPFDSFSMLFVAKWNKNDLVHSLMQYGFPISVFFMQMVIMILLMINLLQTSDRQLNTTMNVPVDVPVTVKISQYIACMVSVFTADDLVTGALLVGKRVVKKGYLDREIAACGGSRVRSVRSRVSFMRELSKAKVVGNRPWKWEVSNSLRIVEGTLVLVVSFIFILQSASAIDLWLNFAAVQFVGLLDDTAFLLSQNRFLGSVAKQLANRVKEFEVHSEGVKIKKRMRRLRLALFIGIGVFMWAGLSFFVYNQAHSTYACRTVIVTVGEVRHQNARHFSGRYNIQDDKINSRAVYVQEQGRGAFLAYCSDNGINRWTISPLNSDESPQNPCNKIWLQSQRTKTHDVSEIGDSMKFWTGDDADADIKCNMCDVSRKGGDCSFRGSCSAEKQCVCGPGFFGDSCQFSGPCTELVGHEEFHGLYTRGYQKNWDLMYLKGNPVMVYERPVYVQNTDEDFFDVIAYDGGRWFVSQSDYFKDWFNTRTEKESAYLSLAKYLTTSFNARHSSYIASYITVEASTKGSPSNLPFRAWLAEAAEDSIGKLGEEEYELFCADCDNGRSDTSGMSYCVGSWGETEKSLCKTTGHEIHGVVNRCECLPGFQGPLCHMRPVEGTSSLHLDHAAGGVCSTCYEDNPWTVWDIDGFLISCLSMGELFFDDGSETFSRQLGLHLNASHFSVFVSSNFDESLNTLCVAKEGTEELYAVRRDNTDERIHVNVAIHLDNRKDFMGEVVKPELVECLSSTEIDHDICSTSLKSVYITPDRKSMLQNAWLKLDLKVTPNLDGDIPVSANLDVSDTPEMLSPLSAQGGDSQVVSSIKSELVSNGETLEIASPPNLPEETSPINPSDSEFSIVQNTTLLEVLPTVVSSIETTSTQPTNATPATVQAQDNSIFSSNAVSNTASAASEAYTFAVVPKATESPFYFDVRDGCEARAAALSRQSVRGSVSVKCLYVGSADVDAAEQAQVVKDLISSGSVDGISIAVIEESTATEVIASAVTAKIPIITFDSDAPLSKRASYVGTDNTALGEELSMLLLTRFARSGKYAIVSDDNPNLFLRETGIRNKLDKNNWSEVPGSPTHVGQSSQSSGPIDMMQDLMRTQPDIDAILITFGLPMVTGEDGHWESFVQQYPDLLILSADSMPKQIDLMNRGFVNGLVGQQPFDMGSKSIDTLLALSKGKEVEDFIATSLVVMGRVSQDTPYAQLSSGSMGFATSLLLLILALPVLAIVLV